MQFAAWGAYLTSMGRFLGSHGHASSIGLFFSTIGMVSLVMPALMGIIADRWIQAQRLYGICHIISASAMITLGIYAHSGNSVSVIYPLYLAAIAFYMPSLSLCHSVAYNALEKSGMDPVATYPHIRPFGTIGFVGSMWAVDLMGWQASPMQFVLSGCIGIGAGLYGLTLPACTISRDVNARSFAERLGLRAFSLFRIPRMAIFFVFAALIGVCIKISDGYANTYISSFGQISGFADTFGVRHANILISLSQISEAACMLLIPVVFKKLGIKKVMIISMVAWALRFGLFGIGNPGDGLWLLVSSCLVYGVAFDFYNVSGSLFVNRECEPGIRSSAQGLFMMMGSGLGSTVGMFGVQWVVDRYVNSAADPMAVWQGWQTSWYIFAAYALIIAIAFAVIFRERREESVERRV